MRAYPRSRGATLLGAQVVAQRPGLSPLTRGNRLAALDACPDSGPIPAHAGQPAGMHSSASAIRAYPRSRGATADAARARADQLGLSPLTRGNRRAALVFLYRHGPIPAHAGQPEAGRRPGLLDRAYPRSRGATLGESWGDSFHAGLSPLTRGNLHRAEEVGDAGGPIPAHAGQPTLVSDGIVPARAYPRSRGATELVIGPLQTHVGLSPLTRGNRCVYRRRNN